jgi:cytoskeletal protein CcmA (bactofilin family)
MRQFLARMSLLMIAAICAGALSIVGMAPHAAADTSFATFSGVVETSSGQPVPDVAVTLGSNYDYTAADGSFTVSAAPGVYSLGLNHDAGDNLPQFNLNGPSVDLTQGNVTQDITLPTATVNVTVLDSSGNPVPGATLDGQSADVSFTGYPGGTITGTIDDQGGTADSSGVISYTSFLGADSITNYLTGPSGSPVVTVTIPAVTTDPTNTTVTLPSSATFSGVVETSSGQPVPDVAVTLGSNYDYTAADGSFTVSAAPGVYSLGLNHDAGDNLPQFNLNGPSVDLTQGNVTQDITLPTATVNVTVLDSSGNPVPGATLDGQSADVSFTGYPGGTITGTIDDQGGTADSSGVISYTSFLGADSITNYLTGPSGSPVVTVTIPAVTTDPTNTTVYLEPPVDTTQTMVSCTPGAVTVGQASTCTATVTDTSTSPSTPSGTVSFTSTGQSSFSAGGSCTLAGSGAQASCSVSYTPSASGSPTITASYGGDGTHAVSSGSTTLTGLDPVSADVSCAPDLVLAGMPATCTVTVTDTSSSPSTPSGTVSFTSTGQGSFSGGGSCTLAGSAAQASCSVQYTQDEVGSPVVTASYAGDGTHAPGTASTTVTVYVDPTQASVSCSPDPVAAGTASMCTATVTDTALSPVTPTGTVSFSSTGPGSFSGGGSCTLSGNGPSGSCQLTYMQAASGQPQITGSYGGDGQHAPSADTATLTVYQPLSGNSSCTGVDGGTGPSVTVPAGATCTLIAGTVVTGNVTDNGTLTLSGVTIDGNLQARNAGPLTLTGPSTTIGGDLQVQGGGPVMITGITIGGNLQIQQLAPSTTMNLICSAQVTGSLQWQNNAAPVTIGGPGCPGNSVGGNLQVQNNTMPSGYTGPAATIEDNTVKGNLQSQNNTPPAVVSGNTVGGGTQTS